MAQKKAVSPFIWDTTVLSTEELVPKLGTGGSTRLCHDRLVIYYVEGCYTYRFSHVLF